MTNTCVCCGVDIPEGRQVCPNCEYKYTAKPDAFLKDGTPLYLKTSSEPAPNFQLFLYKLLTGRKTK